jgi:hypothetical protein
MAATMRDLHIDLEAVRTAEQFNEVRCGSEGGTLVGNACFKAGEVLW